MVCLPLGVFVTRPAAPSTFKWWEVVETAKPTFAAVTVSEHPASPNDLKMANRVGQATAWPMMTTFSMSFRFSSKHCATCPVVSSASEVGRAIFTFWPATTVTECGLSFRPGPRDRHCSKRPRRHWPSGYLVTPYAPLRSRSRRYRAGPSGLTLTEPTQRVVSGDRHDRRSSYAHHRSAQARPSRR